tara:strand:+ start:892 stop:1062 length:171 start_codon:yes stop_codon:yes gene_type:complete
MLALIEASRAGHRNAAIEKKLEVMGTLWLVEKLVQEGVISVERAHQAYDGIKTAGR